MAWQVEEDRVMSLSFYANLFISYLLQKECCYSWDVMVVEMVVVVVTLVPSLPFFLHEQPIIDREIHTYTWTLSLSLNSTIFLFSFLFSLPPVWPGTLGSGRSRFFDSRTPKSWNLGILDVSRGSFVDLTE